MSEIKIDHIAYLFKEAKDNNQPEPIFFLDADASRTGGISLTNESLPVMYVATTPINANMVLQLYGQQPALMTDTQKVNFLMSQYFANSPKLINNYMQSLQSSPQSFYKAIFTDTAMVHAAYFAAYNGQNQTNETFFRNVFTAALNNNNAGPIPLKLANQYGGWIDDHAPGMLAQHAAPKDLASVIYNVAPSDFISDFGSTFGTSVFVGIMKDLPTFSVLGFHKKIKIYFGPGGITGSTYTPPDVSTPSPGSESLLADTLFLAEHHLYGSSRLGIVTYPEPQYRVVYGSTAAADTTLQVRYPWYSLEQDDWMKADKASVFTGSTYHTAVDTAGTLHHIGLKHYELSDHLGNVLVTLSDKRSGYGDNSGNFTAWQPDVWTVSDYYPFGMQMEERRWENKDYRFGYNTQERTDEIAGTGNHNTAEFWEYSPRIGRRWNVDPMGYPHQSHYSTFDNSPISKGDPLGLYGTEKDASTQRQKAKDAGLDPSQIYQSGKEWMFNTSQEGEGGAAILTGHKRQTDFTKSSGASATGRDNTGATLTPFMEALRDQTWYGAPNRPSKHYQDSRIRAYNLGYMPFRPQAIGLSIPYNITGLGTGYAGSINIGFVGQEFGIWHTGGATYGTLNASVGFSGFMSEWHGKGKATFESYMGDGDAYGASFKTPSPVNLDLGYSNGFNEKSRVVWKTIRLGFSISNPKLPGKISLEYQPKTYTHKIINFNEP